ncbi:MAG: CocE/NonD family hydrolase [Bacteroidota bacterium]|nr:CocE/NonD family hydrolase [Bacteroidota bacterium]MDP3144318.1 CocE/NonD family hydrolase [Bacteroidota bacterium]MDP3556304.1 CocE/NonD family hydrolase [Bacteroidota bacterium]
MKTLFFLLFIGIFSQLNAQTIDSAWVSQNYSKLETLIPMRDGKKLFTCIYIPKNIPTAIGTEKHPFLMMRTPYSCAPYGKDQFSPRLYTTNWANYLKENYIIVMQDVRGRYMSEGEFVDVRPFIENKKGKEFDEASDTYDAIDWMLKNIPNNNGNFGVFGISYPGFYSTMAALSNHPALKAVSPQAPVTDWFLGDDFHHNGAFAIMDGFSFYSSFGKPRPKPTTEHAKGFTFPEKDNYSFFLKQGALKNLKQYLGDSIVFWNELMDHPNMDDWWKARNARVGCVNVKPAMLTVGGTFDAEDCYGAWNLYKAIEKQSPKTTNKLVMGPWVHGGWHRGDGTYLGNIRFGSKTAEYYQKNIELPFFEFYLRNKGTENKIAEATIFFSGENNWKNLESWPPKNSESKTIYLKENQKLSFDKPTKTSSFSKYTSNPNKPVPYSEGVHLRRTREYMNDDQRFAARRTDVLVFETEILNDDLTLAGTITANLKVSLSTGDADFVVKVIDVFPDNFKYDSNYCCLGVKSEAEMAGYQMLVRGEIMRGKYRNSFEKPEAFTPNKIETVKFELPDVAHTIKKGHKLMIQIQSSWFPLFDRNPQQFIDIYKCDDKDFISSDIKVFHELEAPSSIVLPILKN